MRPCATSKQKSLVNYLSSLRCSLLIFSVISIWLCPLLIFSSTCIFPLLWVSWLFLIWLFHFFVVICLFPLVIISMVLSFIPRSWLYLLIVCIRISSSFSFFGNSLMSSVYIKWLIFSNDFVNLEPPLHFLSMWSSGTTVISGKNRESASPRKIHPWIFISTKLFPPAINSNF